jgi:hypothetical protein
MVMFKDGPDTYDPVNLIVVADEFAGPLKSMPVLSAMQVKSKRRMASMKERKLWSPC